MARHPTEHDTGTPNWVWALVGCLAMPVLLIVIGMIGLFTSVIPKGQAEAAKTQDMASMRLIVSRLLEEYEMPLAPDGCVDVYKAIRNDIAEERERLCFSARLDSGPTAAQIAAGDYAAFPWARRKGRPPPDGREVLLLWEKAPVDDHRVVAFSSGAVKLLREDEFQGMQEPTGR